MTYSIVVCDRANGQMGVAMQSCLPAVGATAVWARPGVGAVATQGFAEPAYGPRCLDALADGATATEALTTASDLDSGVVLRQVGVVGVDGSVAGHTGAASHTPVTSSVMRVRCRRTWPPAQASRGDISQARHELQGLTAARSSWETIIRGFAAQGLLTVPTSTTLDELLR
ncbi:hypothetical protein GCM10027174_24050 [Salinifilum aidingensis]